MSLNWKASTDNVGVQGYEIYRGTSTSNITPYSTSPTNSFVDTYGAPKGTYYYQIDAYDAAGNHSARSPIVTRHVSSRYDSADRPGKCYPDHRRGPPR